MTPDLPRWRVSLNLVIADAQGHGYTEDATQTISARDGLEAIVLATAREARIHDRGMKIVSAMPTVRPEDDDLVPEDLRP